jgi:DNA-binding IclR family transcriptional regulator
LARPALSASRAIKLLNHLAANPGEAFTLSELARDTEINVASLHAVLDVLAREGYVVREPRRKAYRLGASPIALGQAALDEHPAIQLARQATSELADRLGLEVLCGLIIGPEVLIVGEAGRSDRLYMHPRVGQRMPFMPPLGILGVAYLPAAEQDAWLDRMGPGATAADRDAYLRAAASAGRRGHQVDLETPSRQQIGRLMPELAQDPQATALRSKLAQLVVQLGHEDHTLTDPEPGRSYAVNNVTVPVFGPRSELIAALTLLGFDEPLTTEQIDEYLRVMRDAAERITRATGGRAPLDLAAA